MSAQPPARDGESVSCGELCNLPAEWRVGASDWVRDSEWLTSCSHHLPTVVALITDDHTWTPDAVVERVR